MIHFFFPFLCRQFFWCQSLQYCPVHPPQPPQVSPRPYCFWFIHSREQTSKLLLKGAGFTQFGEHRDRILVLSSFMKIASIESLLSALPWFDFSNTCCSQRLALRHQAPSFLPTFSVQVVSSAAGPNFMTLLLSAIILEVTHEKEFDNYVDSNYFKTRNIFNSIVYCIFVPKKTPPNTKSVITILGLCLMAFLHLANGSSFFRPPFKCHLLSEVLPDRVTSPVTC